MQFFKIKLLKCNLEVLNVTPLLIKVYCVITHSLWHMSQGNLGFTWSGRWHLLCRYSELNCLNAFPHCGHTWGRASVWTVLCDCRTVFWEKHFPHSSHLKTEIVLIKI